MTNANGNAIKSSDGSVRKILSSITSTERAKLNIKPRSSSASVRSSRKRSREYVADYFSSTGHSRQQPSENESNDSLSVSFLNHDDPGPIVYGEKSCFQLLRDYKYDVVESCSEAERGNKYGSFSLKAAPGLPSKKFCQKDLLDYGDGDDWTVQAAYRNPNVPDKLFVVYEGWTSDTGEYRKIEELNETAPHFVKECYQRDQIRDAIVEKHLEDDQGKLKLQTWGKKCDKLFWSFEDLTYFINTIHKKYNLPPIFFIIPQNPEKILSSFFPNYEYTTKNIVTNAAYHRLKEIGDVRKFSEKQRLEMIKQHEKRTGRVIKTFTVCSSDSCKCRSLWWKFYRGNELKCMKYTRTGKLIINNYTVCNLHKIVIECSDDCGCDSTCPNRQFQKEQQYPLAVVYKPYKRFGVYAGADIEKGSFITEYTGVLMCLQEEDLNKDSSYVFSILAVAESFTIDASEKGNVARHINHSCNPNAMSCEAHSRRSSDELLVPRVGIFAVRDIKKGEEISISYWGSSVLKQAAEGPSNKRTHCYCKASNCTGWIPKY